MKFKKKNEVKPGIPMASLPDIVFLLLIFFMVSSVFKEFSGLPVILPQARQIEKLQGKRDVAYIWVSKAGIISVDDKIVRIPDVYPIMDAKRRDVEHPLKLVSMKIDRSAEMGLVNDVQEELRKADALNINYSAKPGI